MIDTKEKLQIEIEAVARIVRSFNDKADIFSERANNCEKAGVKDAVEAAENYRLIAKKDRETADDIKTKCLRHLKSVTKPELQYLIGDMYLKASTYV